MHHFGVYYKMHYYALYVLVPQVLSSIACTAIAVHLSLVLTR